MSKCSILLPTKFTNHTIVESVLSDHGDAAKLEVRRCTPAGENEQVQIEVKTMKQTKKGHFRSQYATMILTPKQAEALVKALTTNVSTYR